MIFLPPLFHETNVRDCVIQYNGERFNVNIPNIREISRLFAEIWIPNSELIIDMGFSSTVFSKFVDIINGEPCCIPFDHYSDLLLLLSDWKCSDLCNRLSKIHKIANLTENSREVFFQKQIDELKSMIRCQNRKISDLEQKIQQNTDKFNGNAEKTLIMNNIFSLLPKSITFNNHPMKGIFYWLRKTIFEIPLSSSNIISIESSTRSRFSSPPCYLLDDSSYCQWFSDNLPHQYIIIDMKYFSLDMIGYSIRTPNSKRGIWHIRSWKVEGSNNKKDWRIIDEHRNNGILDEETYCCMWQCYSGGFFQYFKITQTDLNKDNDNYFLLGGIELFGTVQRLTQ